MRRRRTTRRSRILQSLAKEFPGQPEYRHDLAVAYQEFSILLANIGQFSRAGSMIEQAVNLARQLAAEQPENADYRYLLGKVQAALGSHRNKLGQYEAAKHDWNESMAILEPLVAAAPKNAEYRDTLITVLEGLSSLAEVTGHPPRPLRTQGSRPSYAVLDRSVPPQSALSRGTSQSIGFPRASAVQMGSKRGGRESQSRGCSIGRAVGRRLPPRPQVSIPCGAVAGTGWR